MLAAAASDQARSPIAAQQDQPLYARAEFGLASATPPNRNVVNGGLHESERRLDTIIRLAGSFINFDTRWSDQQVRWDDLGAGGRTVALAWGPTRYEKTVLLSEVAAGKYQDHVDEILSGISSYPHPVVCRWGWEMNGNWSEYAAAYQGEYKGCGDPSEYVAAWRYMVDRSRALRIPNLRWLFCPNGDDVGGNTMEQYWPGADYVDLVGADAYNGFGHWTTFYGLFARPYERLSALKPGSDFWVGETGCIEATQPDVSKAEWAQQMFHETRLPLLRAVTYFDAVGSRDWRIHTSRASQQAFGTGFRLVAATRAARPSP